MSYSKEEIDTMVQQMYQLANDEVKQILRKTDTNTLRAMAEYCLDITAMARDISNDMRGMFSDSASSSISAENVSAQLTNAHIVQALTVHAQGVNTQSVNAQLVNSQTVQAAEVNAQVVQTQQARAQTVQAELVSAIRVKPMKVEREFDANDSFINKILTRIIEFLQKIGS